MSVPVSPSAGRNIVEAVGVAGYRAGFLAGWIHGTTNPLPDEADVEGMLAAASAVAMRSLAQKRPGLFGEATHV